MQQISDLFAYVFDPRPPLVFKYYVVLAILCAVMIGFSIFLRIWLKKQREDKTLKRCLRGYVGKIQLLAVFLAFYLFFRYTGVAYLSVRFLLYIILAAIAYLVFRISKTYFKDYPEMKKHHDQQMHKNAFIPRKNHR